ncbi:M48 family metallopeptidase [Beijerinckia indica]|uniref:Ste24 endopeptidase n=1 Tax=Beijerinckia indica subsp. indica (strain ATCC 9039 / DSM 1715 / NCIMB 8712) TaxID=395963 RepID=B2IIA9_BEII9|nr:M48 family metallopeptidase [Beijerinckia indica]ACB96063.1 Ste24 endopeptidase [Beijerinckia indica subsp. indica ATCC 9039]
MPFFSLAFIAAAILLTGLSIFLSRRQTIYVQAHRNTVPADFATSITLEEHQKAADYTVEREKVRRLESVAELVLTLAWVLGGISLLYAVIAAFVPPSLTRGVVFLLATSAISSFLSLPFDIYKTFGIERKYGFNRTTPATFIADRIKAGILSLAIGVPLLFAALWTVSHFSGFWWLWIWFGLLALMILAPSLYVRYIAPRFNTFAPLADESLRTRIESLLQRCGFRSSGLYSMDASRRSAHGNAYFIGFGNAKRIVLFDTLLAHSSTEEVEAIVAHELGHFRHKHVIYSLIRMAVISFAGLAIFGWLTKQDWLLPSFGIAYKDDALSLFVCMLLGSVVGPLFAPLGNWISRRNEFEADDYAKRNVGAIPMITALTKLARDNASTLTPDPLYALVNYSHPPVPVRIRQLRQENAG